MKRTLLAALLAVIGLGALALATPSRLAHAQIPPDAVPQPPIMMQMGPGMGGQPVMLQDDGFLYVLQGRMIYKVDKSSMKLAALCELPGPRPLRPAREGLREDVK